MEFIISEGFNLFMEISRSIKSGEDVIDVERSISINELEDIFCCELFIRTEEHTSLTTAGEKLYQQLEPLYTKLKIIEQHLIK